MFFMLFCFVELQIRHRKLSNYSDIAKLYIAAFVSISSFIAFLFIDNEMWANYIQVIYFGSMDILLYALFYYVVSLETQKDVTSSKVFKYMYIISALADLGFMLTNPFTHWYFDMIRLEEKGKFLCWINTFKFPYYIHLGLCYFLVLTLFYRLIKDIVRVPKLYKSKFVYIFITFVAVIILNIFFMIFSALWKIDYSVITYGIFAVLVYNFTVYATPRRIQKNMLSIVSNTIKDAVICFDYTGECAYMNEAAKKIFSDGSEKSFLWTKRYLESSENFLEATEILEVEGQIHFFYTEYHRVVDKYNKLCGSYLKLNDRTEDISKKKKERYRANHDDLTGLYKRNYFFSEMERILKSSPNVERYLVCTNIRNFKLINNLFGAKFGDDLLKYQADILNFDDYKDCIKGRVSGDRFAILIDKENFNLDLAIKNTERIKDFVAGINFQFSVCLGIYEIANPYENVHSMLDKANIAIKSIKSDYNKVFALYDASLMQALIEEKKIISEFKYALSSEQFCLFLQPQINSVTKKCVGAEALVRWYDAEQNYRMPSMFIKILENSGLIYQLDYYVWEKAVKILADWKARGFDDYSISVNISAKDFYYADLYTQFTSLVEKYDVSPKLLHLEITESVLIDDKRFHKDILQKLQNYGFRIEMDDFGSGYSSLNTLKELSMDVLKIDMEFLGKTDNIQRSNLIIESVVKMAKALNMEIITEGLETEEQVEFLSGIGVDMFQGFYFSKPIPYQEFEHKYLEAGK